MNKPNNKGMAIAIVLIFSLAMAILGSFIIFNTKQTYQANRKNENQLQAYFIARAGLEHALLKVKYLPRPLYDAACLSQGRNPLYDFSKGIGGISNLNPGPIFLYKLNEAVPVGFFTPNVNSLPSVVTPPDAWLNSYKADVSSGKDFGGTLVNGVMTMAPLPVEVTRHILALPFSGQYELADLKVLANQIDLTSGVTNQAIVEISVTGIIDAPNAQNNVHYELWTETVKRTVKVSRD